MNTSIQVRTRTPAAISPVPEHTPIYDMNAYLARQKQRKFAYFRKTCIDTLSFCFASVTTFSLLFLGA